MEGGMDKFKWRNKVSLDLIGIVGELDFVEGTALVVFNYQKPDEFRITVPYKFLKDEEAK